MTLAEQIANYLGQADLSDWGGAEDIRQFLGCSSMTVLYRRTRKEGIRLTELVEAERRRRVEAALAQKPNIGAKRLAALCGYRELGSFYRAFKAWTGYGWSKYGDKRYGRK